MAPTLKIALKIAAWTVGAVVAVGAVILFRLIHIGTPALAHSLQFTGFVELPKESTLSVLDYLTVSGRSLFVTNESTGTVYKVTLPESGLPHGPTEKNSTSAQAEAHGVALDSSQQVAFVTRSEANVVDVFNTATMRGIASIPVSDDADGIVFDTEHNLVYVAHGGAHLATLIDPQTRAVAATIPLGGQPEFMALDAQTHRLYQNLKDSSSLVEVDLAARTVAQRWNLPGCLEPSGMALDDRGHQLFIACSANARLAVFDLSSHRVALTIPIGEHPDSVAFDRELHRIYTTGKAGRLSVISQDGPGNYHVLDNIALHYGAHTLAVDPRTHYVYVGYASLLIAPRLGVFAPKML